MIQINSGSNHLEIDAWFPTCIGVAFNKDHDEWAPEIIKHLDSKKKKCPKSIGQSSFFLHQCHKDPVLKKLNNWIQRRVDDYTAFYNYPKKYKPVESWFHWYKDGNYADAHIHQGRTISLIYYLQSDLEDGRVVFNSPVPPDMKNPYKITANNSKEHLQKDHSFSECFYRPKEGMLLIFRSYLVHKVELKEPNLKDRIVISWDLD